jgi:hypothetical protein
LTTTAPPLQQCQRPHLLLLLQPHRHGPGAPWGVPVWWA